MPNKTPKILVIHGPNLDMLGKRQPKIYGKCSLAEINQLLQKKAKSLKLELKIIQSNSETAIIEAITKLNYDFLIINPAAFTHTSIAIRDAALAAAKPLIEVHLSNIYQREEFRRKSYLSDIAIGIISGLGKHGYIYALDAAANIILKKN